jgi:hypothetical protein
MSYTNTGECKWYQERNISFGRNKKKLQHRILKERGCLVNTTYRRGKIWIVIEEIKQKVPAKTQQLSRYRKRQNQYYQNKMFRTDCKKFYNFTLVILCIFTDTNYTN